VTKELTVAVVDASLDTTPPTVSLLSPVEGASLSGMVLLRATAVDRSAISAGVSRVDGQEVANFSQTPPWELRFDTSTLKNGSHTFDAVATDGAGNSATSAPANVSVNNGDVGPKPGCGCSHSGPWPLWLALLGLAGLALRPPGKRA
jgi:MYXO-CTERM domain-containing protein